MVIDVIFIILFKHHSQIVHYYHVSCRRLPYLNLLSMHANIFKSLFHMQCKSFNFAPLGLIAYIWKRVILAFISFFWLQRLLVFVSNTVFEIAWWTGDRDQQKQRRSSKTHVYAGPKEQQLVLLF